MYRNLHVPTTWRLLAEIYEDLDVQRVPFATKLAFFLGIFAGSAYVSNSNLKLEFPASTRTPPLALAELWHKQRVFLLTKPPVPPSTQALVALMTLAHLCTQIEGFSGSFEVLAMTALQIARTMRIHRLDSYHFREERKKNGADMVDIELKRRVWWHIAASDWLLSNVGGPHEGTYMLHPSQIETFHPSNAEDCDIPTGITHITEDSYSKPLSTPTTITYFLWRLQIATPSRKVTDLLTPTFCTSPDIDNSDEMYSNILLLDQKYQQLLKSLPPFFQLTNRMNPKEYSALIKDKPYLEPQRYLINFVLHTNLARLHRRFLIRGSTQPKFAYSRMQCIQSTETVLEVRNLVIGNKGIGSFTYFLLAHFFMAAVILAMDVCFNPNEIRVEKRKQDVLRACRVLEEELGAKMEPNESGGEDSNGRVMLKAFQKAVLNLRALLKRMNRTEKMQQPETTTDFMEARREVSPNDPFAKGTFTKAGRQMRSAQDIATNTQNYSSQPGNYASTNQSAPEEEMPLLHPPYDEPQPPTVFAVDNMWEEFFTVGSDFNSTDWDTFLIDLDEQMAGMGSET
ncbi:hypothetical protein NA56DRAFT_573765 [Hyaloscypha hepaticicola]|uniref:Transcription factor domain-containing protein n=1 Tax=Hyaloscypha hepaticicola TaxID=2082293 RepID=A0A2J6Q331_9HELO|nr:hypothetical protein NA56DRAFT_573765 [Hyaloscypha hepaticicola]